VKDALVVIGLGANLGDCLGTLRKAVSQINLFCEVVNRSRVYETAPIGPAQPNFLNAAISVQCMLPPLALLDALGHIETDLGRDRENEVRWGPRTIDLDILWTSGPSICDARLVVPHPRLHERAFAVLPLLDVAPDARDPMTGRPYVVPDDQLIHLTPWQF